MTWEYRSNGVIDSNRFYVSKRFVVDAASGAKVAQVLGTVDDALKMVAALELLEACIALQSEARARNCGLRIADEAIAKALGQS